MKRAAWTIIAVSVAAFVLAYCLAADRDGSGVPRPLTVAFIGDQGAGESARRVLELIRAEGAELVLHQGDLGYGKPPAEWDALITDVFGADFPYFATIGNHDVHRWYGADGYQVRLQARLDRIEGAHCTGDLGVKAVCSYRGLTFIQSGIGTLPDRPDEPDHIAFLKEQLARSEGPWTVCSWHKDQREMQLGHKADEVGWAAYEACREAGAIIATAHEHSYSRTHLMDNFQRKSIASTASTLHISEGRTFAFVSGLGGRSIRAQERGGPWWAAVYTKVQKANYGALICTFFENGELDRASCYFKDLDGAVPDRFDIINERQYHMG